ncbi:MAG: hypothetical protein DRN17_07850 [Thermoplasmata archaeon]|nr:MAG: hypothetical protein DRN17_07850 [Thermoplasmata archaeon]
MDTKEILEQIKAYEEKTCWTSEEYEALIELKIRLAIAEKQEHIEFLEGIIYKLVKSIPLNKKEEEMVREILNVEGKEND